MLYILAIARSFSLAQLPKKHI